MSLGRRELLTGGAAVGMAGLIGVGTRRSVAGSDVDGSWVADWGEQDPPEPYDAYDEDEDRHVVSTEGDGDFQTIQAAVDAADPRDLILVEPGVYHEEVEIHDTSHLTIRGTDRSEVILDGEFERYNGIVSTRPHTVVENLTVRNYNANGVYWISDTIAEPIRGYRGSYLTAYNNRVYGIYARNAEHGRFEHCYASGCDDAGFYIGESQPAHAVITDCLAEHNAMGYSGTNAGGDLVIRNSTWRDNMTGIVPNTLDSQAGAPQGHAAGGILLEDNHVHDNNDLSVPAIANAYAIYGTGIAVAGGQRNVVRNNTIEDQHKYGVVVFPMLTDTAPARLPLRLLRGFAPGVTDDRFYSPEDNVVAENVVRGSGRVDIALAAPARGNVFDGNDFGSSRPALVEHRDGSFGDPMVFLQVLKDFTQTEVGDYPRGRTEDQPVPDPAAVRAALDEYEMEAPRETPPRTPLGGIGDE